MKFDNKIYIYLVKILDNKKSFERKRIGEITILKNGNFQVKADTSEAEGQIKKAVDREIKNGVFGYWGEREGDRIVDYAKVVNPNDPLFVSCLADQLFGPDDLLNGWHLTAMTKILDDSVNKRDKKAIDKLS